jgi:hypothetical protein
MPLSDQILLLFAYQPLNRGQQCSRFFIVFYLILNLSVNFCHATLHFGNRHYDSSAFRI